MEGGCETVLLLYRNTNAVSVVGWLISFQAVRLNWYTVGSLEPSKCRPLTVRWAVFVPWRLVFAGPPILVHWKLTILGLAVPYSVAEVSGRNTLTFPPALTYEAPPTASDDVDAASTCTSTSLLLDWPAVSVTVRVKV